MDGGKGKGFEVDVSMGDYMYSIDAPFSPFVHWGMS